MYTQHPQLWLSEMAPDGLSLVGDMKPLQAPTHGYQRGLLEAPYLVFHPPSKAYVLFFSSGTFSKDTYATSYAISRSGLFGPYHCPPHPFLETDRSRHIMGPGGACVVQGVDDEYFIIFHALEREEGNRRTCLQRISFGPDGTPSLSSRPNCGKRLRLGAEHEDDLHHFGNAPVVNYAAQEGQGQTVFGAGAPGGKLGKFVSSLKNKLN